MSRRSSRWIGMMVAVMMLAGCADGTAPEAERARRSDATRESVVDDLQATETWNIIHGSPESTPESDE